MTWPALLMRMGRKPPPRSVMVQSVAQAVALASAKTRLSAQRVVSKRMACSSKKPWGLLLGRYEGFMKRGAAGRRGCVVHAREERSIWSARSRGRGFAHAMISAPPVQPAFPDFHARRPLRDLPRGSYAAFDRVCRARAPGERRIRGDGS